MSIRTLVEINHDYLHRMRDHPQEFVEALWHHLSGSGYEGRELWDGARAYRSRHHSDPWPWERETEPAKRKRQPPTPEPGTPQSRQP